MSRYPTIAAAMSVLALAAAPAFSQVPRPTQEAARAIALSQVPKVVFDSARKALGREPADAQVVNEYGVTVYELCVTDGKGNRTSVHLTPDGRVLEVENE